MNKNMETLRKVERYGGTYIIYQYMLTHPSETIRIRTNAMFCQFVDKNNKLVYMHPIM